MNRQLETVTRRLELPLSRARYAAIGAAIGGGLGGLINRNAASSGAAVGALVGAAVGESRATVRSRVDEMRGRSGGLVPKRESLVSRQ